jgi:hypothetical protein
MTASDIPTKFVLTKIGSDAGQGIDRILRRKELERQAGGTLWWGIGEAQTAEKIALLGSRPPLIFSHMSSKPHKRDSHPDDVLLWERYTVTGSSKTVPLPSHAIVISRAHAQNGNLKSRYYALVCESPSGIPGSAGGQLDIGSLRNLGGRQLGSSQITAVVERPLNSGSVGKPYVIAARANLVAPFAVSLAAPRLLKPEERRLLDDVSDEGKTVNDWMAVARRLRS